MGGFQIRHLLLNFFAFRGKPSTGLITNAPIRGLLLLGILGIYKQTNNIPAVGWVKR